MDKESATYELTCPRRSFDLEGLVKHLLSRHEKLYSAPEPLGQPITEVKSMSADEIIKELDEGSKVYYFKYREKPSDQPGDAIFIAVVASDVYFKRILLPHVLVPLDIKERKEFLEEFIRD